MIRLSLLLFLLASAVASGQSTGSGIERVSAHQVSTGQAQHPHVESYIAVDAKDPRHILTVAMAIVSGQTRPFPYVSFDAGRTWVRGTFRGDSSMISPSAGDPAVYITSSGCYFTVIGLVNGADRSMVARSTDGCRTWIMTSVLPYADRQWLAFGRGGPFSERVFFTGTGVFQSRDASRSVAPFFASSDDYTATFTHRTLLTRDRGGVIPTAMVNAVPLEPLVSSRGLIAVMLQGAPDSAAAEEARRDSLSAWSVGLMLSDDGGETFGPVRVSSIPRLGTRGSPRRRLRGTSAEGYFRTTIDVSTGQYRDRIYVTAATYDRTTDRYVVQVWSTADFGKTWGTAIASDAPRGDVANPAIAVNRDGVVALTWNDRRDDPNGRCWRLYAAVSRDGGAHFMPAERLSVAPTCTQAPANWDTFGTAFNSDQTGEQLAHIQSSALVPTRFPMGGDTQGLAADATGVFHAAWINGETGVMQLWHTAFRSTAVPPRLAAPAAARSGAGVEPSPLEGEEEVTRDIEFRITGTRLDFSQRTYALTVAIENTSGRPLRGPFRAVMRHFLDPIDRGLGLADLAVANADDRGTGIGSTFTFGVNGVLAPGARTKERTLTFTFTGGVPEFPEGYLSPGFRVYGHKP